MSILLAFLFPFLSHIDAQPEAFTGYETKKEAYGKKMMAASANPLSSKVGFSVLEQGGSALDAALAMQMVLTLVEPQSSGIGGGGILLYYSKKDDEVIAYDGRETAPSGFLTPRIPNIVGGKSVGTPGVLKMLEMAHQEHGVIPWKDLFEPAIQLAEEGFPVSTRLNKLIQKTSGLSTFPRTRDYLFENGLPKAVGKRLKNPALAKTLRLIAEEGSAPFYTGIIAQDIVEAVQNAPVEPGMLTLEDLADYRAIRRKPIKTRYHEYTVYGFPPPSSGGIAIAQILGMLSGLSLDQHTLNSPQFIQMFCQASRAAYADRQQYVGDPDFINIPIDYLLNPIYLSHRLTNPTKTPISALEHPSTTQICVIDKEGNAVSFTTSIEYAFGSTLMVDGFFLNNQMTDFSTGPNRIEPGKRPMSSMAPTFVFENDQLILTVGSAGGARIIDYVGKALFGVLDFGLTIQDAISFPNFTSLTETIDLEKDTFLQQDAKALQGMGNQVRLIPLTSGTQGIQITPSGLIGGVDPRREGLAIGD